jgi:hypothetical protein
MSPRKSWDNKSVAKFWKRKYLYSERETEMKSLNYCTHCKMSGHWSSKCWKFHPELHGTPRKKRVPESMQLEARSSVAKKMAKYQIS